MEQIMEIDIGMLEQDANAIMERISVAQKNIEKLREIEVFLRAGWQGASSDSYLAVLRAHNEKLDLLTDEGKKLSNNLIDAVKIYKQCEMDVSSEIESIR